MKVRNGFVSNSSSSSFIIVVKDKEIDLKEQINKLFQIDNNHLLSPIAIEIANIFYDNAIYYEDGKKLEDKFDYYDLEYNPDYNYYYGFISSEDPGLECRLCDVGIDYEDENIIIKKEKGY